MEMEKEIKEFEVTNYLSVRKFPQEKGLDERITLWFKGEIEHLFNPEEIVKLRDALNEALKED